MLHIQWGILLIIDPSAAWATAVNSVAGFGFNHIIEGIILIIVSLFCAVGLVKGKYRFSYLDLLYVIPQQFLLIMSGAGAINAMISQKFADGVVRPFSFISADQAPYVWISIFHAAALITHFKKSRDV